MTDEKLFEWVPTVRLGPVHFGDEAADHVEKLSLRTCMDPFNENEFLCYGYGNDEEPSYFPDENGRVENIICSDHLFYRGEDLMGLLIDSVIDILGVSPDEFGEVIEDVEGEAKLPVEFDSLGLQVWIRDSYVVSAVVSFANEDEDD